MKKKQNEVLFCRVCECDVEAVPLRSGSNATRRDSIRCFWVALGLAFLSILFPWSSTTLLFIAFLLAVIGVLGYFISWFLSDPVSLWCPMCGRDDLVPTISRYAMQAPPQREARSPMHIRPDYKVTPPSKVKSMKRSITS